MLDKLDHPISLKELKTISLMKNKDKFFFFGFGQTAKYFVNNLIKSKKNFSISATNTTKTILKYIKGKKFKSFKFNDKSYDKKLVKELTRANYILVSIPPQKKGMLYLADSVNY